jgi:DNA polymerase-3 subunit alpha
MAGYGIQPIVGCELAIDFGDQDPNARNALAAAPSRIVLLAARERGYRSLMRLNSRAFLETPVHQSPHIKFEWLEGDAEDLIALTGGPDGPISLALHGDHTALAATRCDRLARLFGDRLYVELQRHGVDRERRTEAGLIDLAYAKGLPLVATNEPYFASNDDYEAHDALLCIAGGRLIAETDREQLTPDHRFKTRAEMAVLFADIPEALASTVEIAERCSFRPMTRKPILPRFTVGAGTNAADAATEEAAELRRQAEEGLRNRLKVHGLSQGTTEEDYSARLAFELDVITRMNYAGYFLIVADFIKHAKSKGIPVGPGRGSGAGSLVAYALTITDLDPIRFGLLFERFLNPERVSMPDFDIDFCQDRRGEVIDYVQQRYGRDQVAQIITFGTLQARGVLRDVGRVLQMPYGQVDKLTKLVPQNPAAPVTLAAAIASEPKLQAFRDEDAVVARAFDIAQRLEGLTRHASTHAAGIVIGDRPLSELVPLYRDPKSDMPVTQFNMKWVEPAGLVKFDFLGLKTLTVLDVALKLLKQRNIDVDLATLPLDDAPSYQMLARGDVVGVFQVESQGMRRALVDMRPDRFEDIIALVALYRPGPIMHPDLLRPQVWRRGTSIYAPAARADPEGNLRRHHLPGTGNADRAGDGRLLARRSRPVAAGDGQKDPRRDGEAARALHRGLGQERCAKGAGRHDLRTARQVRRLRLQQEPRRGLCAGVLPHRLHEGALSGRVPRGLDDARTQQHRQAVGISRRSAAARH